VSGDHGHDSPYDPETGFHPSCVTDRNRPVFDAEWQRRAFGLAVALSEFGHYDWADFQRELIDSIGRWEAAPENERARWAYYARWVDALVALVRDRGMTEDGYTGGRASAGITG